MNDGEYDSLFEYYQKGKEILGDSSIEPFRKAWDEKNTDFSDSDKNEIIIGNLTNALYYFEKALKFKPEDSDFLMSKGFALAYRFLAFHDSGYKKRADWDLQRAIDTFDKVTENPQALYHKGRAFFYRGNSFRYSEKSRAQENFDEAIKYFEEYLGKSKNDLDKRKTLYEKGLVLRYKGIFHKEIGHEEEGNKELLNARKLFEEIANDKESEAFYYQALTNRELGNKDKALELLKKSIEINQGNEKAWYDKGLLYSTLNMDEQALEAFDNATIINKKYAKAWKGKGGILNKLKKFSQAVVAYNKVIDNFINYKNIIKDENNIKDLVDAFIEKIYCLSCLGKYEEALYTRDAACNHLEV